MEGLLSTGPTPSSLAIVMTWSDVPSFVKFDFQISLEDQFTNATSPSQYNYVLPIVKFVFQIGLEDLFTNVTTVLLCSDALPLMSLVLQIGLEE